jgi:hypothetical protein
MLIKEHSFKLFVGGKIYPIVVEELISHGEKWRDKCRAIVLISTFESKAFYAPTPEDAAEHVVRYYTRLANVRSIDQASLQVQLRQDTGTHDK